MRVFTLVIVVFASALLVACESQSPYQPRGLSAMGLTDGTPTAVAVLNLLNHPSMTADVLRDEVGLDGRAAGQLRAYRLGVDGVVDTADDNVFASVHDVDATVLMRQPDAHRLLDYVHDMGWLPSEHALLGTWDDVSFTAAGADATLKLVNLSTDSYLLHAVPIDSRAADSILAARPVASVAILSELYWVGPATLQALKDHACAVVD